VQVVHAVAADARAIAEIQVSSWREAYASIVPSDYLASMSVERREVMWSECIAKGIPEVLVASEAGVVCGWLSFGPCRDEGAPGATAEIWALYVSPSSWSSGAGRLLWRHAKALMRAQGFTACSLWVFPQNDRAITFYRKAGFVHDGSAPQHFELGGAPLHEVRWVTRIDE